MVKLPCFFPEKIDRLERPFAMFAYKVVKLYPAVGTYGFNAKCPFFAAASRHDLRPERDLHFWTSPRCDDRPVIGLFLFSKHRSRSLKLLSSYALPFGGPDRPFLWAFPHRTFAKAERSAFGWNRKPVCPMAFAFSSSREKDYSR